MMPLACVQASVNSLAILQWDELCSDYAASVGIKTLKNAAIP